MTLEWSILALTDRNAIFEYIEANNVRAAVAIDNRIRKSVATLTQFPEMGRIGRIEGTRELVITRTPYVAAYRIVGETLRILRVLHGAQQWPEEMPDRSE